MFSRLTAIDLGISKYSEESDKEELVLFLRTSGSLIASLRHTYAGSTQQN